MKFKIICHLAAFLSVTIYKGKGGQMTNNGELHVLFKTESAFA